MQLSAILVTGKPASSAANDSELGSWQSQAASLACVDVFGQSVLDRIVERLQQSGFSTTVVAGPGSSMRRGRGLEGVAGESLSDRWLAASQALSKCAQRGRGVVFVAELGAYVEFDLERVLQFHKSKGEPITPFHDKQGALSYWLVDADYIASNLGVSFPFNDDETKSTPFYLGQEYVNRLAEARDLRRLVVDAFLGRCSIVPQGREIKPGVWIEKGARLHKTARLVPPVYVGRKTRIESAAVITRFSNLEHGCHVGEGSMVADTSVFPHTSIGRGLDLFGAVVDGGEYSDLRRNVTLKFNDPNLLAEIIAGECRVSSRRTQSGALPHPAPEPELEYSQFLTRAAGRLLEAFKGEA